METTDFDIDKICRTCLQQAPLDSNLLMIWDQNNSVDGVFISEMLSECIRFPIVRFDDFPDLICDNCKNQLKNAYLFKKQCERSHRKILTHLESIGRKPATNINVIEKDEKTTQTDNCEIYPCEKCDKKFFNFIQLRDHRLEAHKGTKNECRICHKTFRRIGYLKGHYATAHPESGHTTSHECKFCQKKFLNVWHMNRHVQSMHTSSIVKSEEPATVVESSELKEDLPVAIKEENPKNLEENEVPYEFVKQESSDDEVGNENEDIANDPFDSDSEDEPLQRIRVPEVKSESPVPRKRGRPPKQVVDVSNKDDSEESLDKKSTRKRGRPAVKIEYDSNLDSDESQKSPKPKLKRASAKSTDGAKKVFPCPELGCDKTFSRQCHVKRHSLTHLQVLPFKCDVCDKGFSREDHLKYHKNSHLEVKPYTCTVCNKGFVRPDHLKHHKETKHGDPKQVEALKTEICPICNKGFAKKSYLEKHVRNHANKNYKCRLCHERFPSREELAEHLKTHGNNARPFLCTECGQGFVRNDYLKIHMRRHNGEKPYKCRFCDKGFPRATDLNVHEKYHTNDRPHMCITCGKRFSRHYNLVIHNRIHTGEKPNACPHCPRRFIQRNDLKAHIRRHTGERLKCDLCSAAFLMAYQLANHKRDEHGIQVEKVTGRVEKFVTAEPVPPFGSVERNGEGQNVSSMTLN